MVSTRGVRYKFSEGERVLCYEPDPTKAKVLYDSKVLEVIESKDKRGRRTVEYLIHFQGWNSSWDRCVSEDFVLKDTEENRQLQRDLAEKSQLQLGAYLYRRERKKTSSASTGAGPAKRARHGFSDDGSSSSTQPDDTEGGEGDGCDVAEGCATGDGGEDDAGDGDGEGGDTDSSTGSNTSTPHCTSPAVGRAHIALPSALRDRLTYDYHLVVKRGRVWRLPASPSAAQVLEGFVKWFARAGAWRSTRLHRHEPPPKPDLLDVSCRLNLVREVADGLRVYFDFILRGHLLYKQELRQYHQLCGQFIEKKEPEIKTEIKEEYTQEEQEEKPTLATIAEEDLKSPKMPEYSHLPPDPILDNIKAEDTEAESLMSQSLSREAEEESIKLEAPEFKDQDEENDDKENQAIPEPSRMRERTRSGNASRRCSAHSGDNKENQERPGPSRHSTRSGHVRLRSHRPSVSHSLNEESNNSSPVAADAVKARSSSSGSSLSESGSRSDGVAASAPPPPPPPATAPTRTPLSQLLDKVAKWKLIPRENTEHLPCRVYGAIHLARLFVKLPDFLNSMQMPDFKLKLILKHIDMFIQYLDQHSEWFGEGYYVADNMPRSH